MNVAIVEDERPALEHLRAALSRCAPEAQVVMTAATVRDAVAWLRAHPAPDLILADIELADGQSLRIFEQVRVQCPVVFCTAYDEYVAEAMRCNGIDYLLKPIEVAALSRAVARYRDLEQHFAGRLAALARDLAAAGASRHRERLIGRRGADRVAVSVGAVAYVAVEDGVLVAVDAAGQRYLLDGALGDLEADLDPREFFRANRQVIVRAGAVRSFRSAGKGKLAVAVEPTGIEVTVSQETAARFRAWLDR